MAFNADGLYNDLKNLIAVRSSERLKDCRDKNSKEEILRAQGAARELAELESIIEDMENPPKEEAPAENG